VTLSDFELNVDLDESLFSVEPPAGYQVTTTKLHTASTAPPQEKDLIELFRYYCRLSGGTFPELLDNELLTSMLYEGLWMMHGLERPRKSDEKNSAEHYAVQDAFQRGLRFVVRLPKEADVHYAGRDVRLGAADTPVFWYRPQGAKKYRVVYGDLSIHESAAPPRVPAGQPDRHEEDLVEALRQHCELSGGTFPDALDMGGLFVALATWSHALDAAEAARPRSAQEEQEVTAARVKIQRGSTFLHLLPKDADLHYAGRRVSRGAADKPIAWYRPSGATTYRVIYADLSVRDAATPPTMPEILPEQDLIDALRECSDLGGGRFPDTLDMTAAMEHFAKNLTRRMFLEVCEPRNRRQMEELLGRAMLLQKSDRTAKKASDHGAQQFDEQFYGLVDWEKVAPGKKLLTSDDKKQAMDAYSKKWMKPQLQQISRTAMRIQPGLTFVSQLPPAADAHYAGKGASRGAADKPIFWYRPKDSTKYRVIYGDLTVRESDAAPRVPDAQTLLAIPDSTK
jgi:hypothetical protein